MTAPTCPRHDTTRPCAIIVDLDQTLALLHGRDPYDASQCDLDGLNTPVAELVHCYQATNPGHHTLILTGRPKKHRQPTVRFLEGHDIAFDWLYMRDDDDWTSGAFYKWAIYKRHIEGRYNIHAVFDDDETVCRMFAQEGLPVFRVGDPSVLI